MHIPQDSVPSFIAIALFVLLMAAVSLMLSMRTWRIRKEIGKEIEDDLDALRSRWSRARDRLRAWRDPEFRRRLTAFRDYERCVGVIQGLRERAAMHYVMSEQSSSEDARRRHAATLAIIESAIPGIAGDMAVRISGMTDEELSFVAEGLSKMVSDPRLAKAAGSGGAAIGPDRFVLFLRSERGLLLREPRSLETHADRLAQFIREEAEAVGGPGGEDGEASDARSV